MTAAPFAWAPEMIRLCDACKAFVFKGPGREKQYLCINCGETIFHNPDITHAWRADSYRPSSRAKAQMREPPVEVRYWG